jgi:hypothetical protein
MEKNMNQKFKIKGFIKAEFIMIIILGGIVTYGISNNSQNSTVNRGAQNSVDNFTYSRAHDIASSMADILFERISDDTTYRVNTRVTEHLNGGEAAYTVKDAFIENDNLIEIKVTAKFNDVMNMTTHYLDREAKQKKRINVRFVNE